MGVCSFPSPLSYLWLSTRFFFTRKRSQLRENLPCFFGRKPGRGWRWCEVSCKKRLPTSYNHIFILLPHVLHWGHYTVSSVQTFHISNFMKWNLEWNNTKDIRTICPHDNGLLWIFFTRIDTCLQKFGELFNKTMFARFSWKWGVARKMDTDATFQWNCAIIYFTTVEKS